MKRIAQILALMSIAGLSAGAPRALAATSTWAKKAAGFPEQCWSYGDYKFQDCKPVRIPSPDGRSSVDVFYRPVVVTKDDHILQAFLRVTTPTQGAQEAALPEGFQKVDLLWSPDSKEFFVNGGNGGAYWGFWVYVYQADHPTSPIDIDANAQSDMLKAFPPCKAAYPDAQDPTGCKSESRDVRACGSLESGPKFNPEYNMTGIDWVGPSSILVMSEVPCSSSYGGIMCQVMGYELEIPTGRILKRIDAKQLKLEWQKSMAWNFRIPDPPEYCPRSDPSPALRH